MTEEKIADYPIREVVGVFHDAQAMEKAADALAAAGLFENKINFLGAREAIETKLGGKYEPVEKMVDDPKVTGKAFVPRANREVATAAVFGLPIYVAAMAGSLAVLATGGAAAMALAAAAGGAGLGAGIGALLAYSFDEGHSEKLAQEIEAGGLLVWVEVNDDKEEEIAQRILREHGATHVYAHSIERSWTTKDIPFSDANPDPLLEPDS